MLVCFHLGSLNYTKRGVTHNDERVHVSRGPGKLVADDILYFQYLWLHGSEPSEEEEVLLLYMLANCLGLD